MDHRVTEPDGPVRVNPKALERLRFGKEVKPKEPVMDKIILGVLIAGSFFIFLWVVIEAICFAMEITK